MSKQVIRLPVTSLTQHLGKLAELSVERVFGNVSPPRSRTNCKHAPVLQLHVVEHRRQRLLNRQFAQAPRGCHDWLGPIAVQEFQQSLGRGFVTDLSGQDGGLLKTAPIGPRQRN